MLPRAAALGVVPGDTYLTIRSGPGSHDVGAGVAALVAGEGVGGLVDLGFVELLTVGFVLVLELVAPLLPHAPTATSTIPTLRDDARLGMRSCRRRYRFKYLAMMVGRLSSGHGYAAFPVQPVGVHRGPGTALAAIRRVLGSPWRSLGCGLRWRHGWRQLCGPWPRAAPPPWPTLPFRRWSLLPTDGYPEPEGGPRHDGQ